MDKSNNNDSTVLGFTRKLCTLLGSSADNLVVRRVVWQAKLTSVEGFLSLSEEQLLALRGIGPHLAKRAMAMQDLLRSRESQPEVSEVIQDCTAQIIEMNKILTEQDVLTDDQAIQLNALFEQIKQLKVRFIREQLERGLQGKFIAKLIGVSPAYVSQINKGHRGRA